MLSFFAKLNRCMAPFGTVVVYCTNALCRIIRGCPKKLTDVEATAGIPMGLVVREARTSIGESGVENPPTPEQTDPLPQQLSFAIFIEEYINNPPRDTTALYNMEYPFQGNPTNRLMQLYRQYTQPPD